MAQPKVIVDSSVWIDHIHGGDAELTSLLKRNRAAMHPMVYGEIALGSLKTRKIMLTELLEVPQAIPVSHSEVIAMIEWLELHSTGIGYVDSHLLAATRLIKDGTLLTRDKRLLVQARRLELAFAE